MALEMTDGSQTAAVGPTDAQLARERSLRRFNLAFVYVPIGLAALAVVVLLGLLVWAAIVGGWFGTVEVGTGRSLASGLADTVFLLFTIPCALVCPILPLAFFAGLLAARKQDKAPLRRLRELFRSLDNWLHRADAQVNKVVPRLVQPLVAGRSRLARLEATGRKLLGHSSADTTEEL